MDKGDWVFAIILTCIICLFIVETAKTYVNYLDIKSRIDRNIEDSKAISESIANFRKTIELLLEQNNLLIEQNNELKLNNEAIQKSIK